MDTEIPPGRRAGQEARRQRTVEAALRLLDDREYDRIQVKDVAEEAGVALGTLYHYFGSKEQLFGEALVQWAASLGTDITRRPLSGDSEAGRLEEVLHRAVRAFERQPPMARLVTRLQASDDPTVAALLQRLESTTTTVYLEVLREIDEPTAQRIVRVIDAVLDSGLRAWSAGRIPIDRVYCALSDAVALMLPH